MVVSVRTFDDGAWIHVNDERAVSNSAIWRLAGDVCDCRDPLAHLLLEAFLDVGLVGRDVEARAVGQCIDCGTEVMEWVTVGRVVDGAFEPAAPGAVQPAGAGGWRPGAGNEGADGREGATKGLPESRTAGEI